MSNVTLPEIILQNLIKNEEFTRQCLPYIKKEYFETRIEQEIFEVIEAYFNKSNELPNKNILLIEINEAKGLNDSSIIEAKEKINELLQYEIEKDIKWLKDKAEQWCKERAIWLAIEKSINIYDGTNKELHPHIIPDLVKEALSVSFNTDIGIDWEDDAEERFNNYQNNDSQNKIAFDLQTLNDITFGGVKRKTLSLILGGVHVGKTLTLVHLASDYVRLGYNVLYITLEMDEIEILHRIDANLLKTSMNEIKNLGKEVFMSRVQYLKSKNYGRIKVVQYPTGLSHCGHFKILLNEMKMKLNWRPDIILFDYIGIISSSRIKVGSTNSHFFLKSVAEEIRALSIEENIVAFSAMQLNREGMTSSDIDITNIAESLGLASTADFIFAANRTEELDHLGQISFKQLKNRFRKMQHRSKFVLGVDLEKQLLYDLGLNQQNLIIPQEIVELNQKEIQEKFERSNNRTRRKFENIDVGD